MNTTSQLKCFKSGNYTYLYIYFKYRGKIIRINTQQEYVKGWHRQDLYYNSKVPDYESKNQQIKNLQSQVNKYISEQLQWYKPEINQKTCVEYLNSGTVIPQKVEFRLNNQNKVLDDYFDDYIKHRKSTGTPYGTLKEFTTCRNRVKAFDVKRKKQTVFDDINLSWADSFAEHLNAVGYKQGTIEKTYTILKTVLYHFYERRKTNEINLSDEFTYKSFKRGDKSINKANGLNKQQLEGLEKFSFEKEYLNRIKDRFMWQCYTGLRFSDAFTVTTKHIIDNWLVITPKKTSRYNKEVKQPLHYKALEIFNRYGQDMTTLKITNQAYNKELKEMFNVIRAQKTDLKFGVYATHSGRDTFISMCVQSGVDWKSILGWVGQSSYAIMDRYINLTDDYQKEQMKKLK